MGWLKRNLFVIIALAVAVCAVGALALEFLPGTREQLGLVRHYTPAPKETAIPADPNDGAGATAGPVTGTEFQNSAAPAGELVKTWPEYGKYSQYELALALDPDSKTMRGALDFTYLNAEDQPMQELHFMLYPNSHEKESYQIFESAQMGEAYPNGFSPGRIDVESVTSPDGKVNFAVTGEQNQVLQVRLPRAVSPGETVKLSFTYTVTIPNSLGRFGYGDNTMNLVNCNPILAVYDKGKWFDYPYYNMGDPFYSETADFKATITAPSDWTIAATGVLTRADQGGTSVWTVDAPGRRDFGFVASNQFEVMQQQVNGVLVRSYYLKGDKSAGREALDCGVQSIELYSETFGDYPFAEFSVVEADFFIGGMEYPGMVMIDQSLYRTSGDGPVILDLVVAHETGHQWWYSVIGDNEVTEPWLDEGLTEFTTQYFFEKERDQSYNDYYRMMNDYYQQMRQSQDGQYAVTLPVSSFRDGQTYSAWVYDRTAQILKKLRSEIGDDAFFTALRKYYEANRLGVTTRDDLEAAFESTSGRELTQWFEQQFNSAGND